MTSIRRIGVTSVLTLGSTLELKRSLLIGAHHAPAREGPEDGVGAPLTCILAIAMVLDGFSREEAARLCGMDRQSLRDWVHRYNQEGVDGLADRARTGRPANLSWVELGKFSSWVEEGADLKVVRAQTAETYALPAPSNCLIPPNCQEDAGILIGCTSSIENYKVCILKGKDEILLRSLSGPPFMPFYHVYADITEHTETR